LVERSLHALSLQRRWAPRFFLNGPGTQIRKNLNHILSWSSPHLRSLPEGAAGLPKQTDTSLEVSSPSTRKIRGGKSSRDYLPRVAGACGFSPFRASHSASYPLDLVSCRWRPWGCALQSLSPSRSRSPLGACYPPAVSSSIDVPPLLTAITPRRETQRLEPGECVSRRSRAREPELRRGTSPRPPATATTAPAPPRMEVTAAGIEQRRHQGKPRWVRAFHRKTVQTDETTSANARCLTRRCCGARRRTNESPYGLLCTGVAPILRPEGC